MAEQSKDIIGETYALTSVLERPQRIQSAERLANTIRAALRENASMGQPVVFGEAGVPQWDDAAYHLVGRARLHPIEAWMVAEVVASGAVAAHQIINRGLVSEETYSDLTHHLAVGALALTPLAYRTT